MTAPFAVLLLTCLPGLLFVITRKPFPALSRLENIPIVVTTSLLWWTVGFWLLRILPISFSLFLYGTIISSLIFLWRIGSRNRPRQTGHNTPGTNAWMREGYILLTFILFALPSLYTLTHRIAPPGQDMSMHAYIARVIVDTNAFPRTLRPIVPVDQFGYYPVGFSVLVAALMRLSHIPVYTAARIINALTYWLSTALLYILLRRRFSVYISASVALLIGWALSIIPDIMSWGASPTVLSFDYLLFGCAFLFARRRTPDDVLLSGITWYGAFLTHYMLPVAGIYIAIPLSILFFRQIWSMVPRYSPLRLLATLGISIPFLWHVRTFPFAVSRHTLQYVAKLQHDDLLVWTGAPGLRILFATISFVRTHIPDPILLLYLGSLMFLCVKDRKSAALHFIYDGVLILLIMNSRYWALPFSSLLYPDRIILLAILPIALGIGQGLSAAVSAVYQTVIIPSRRNRFLLYGTVLLLLGYVYAPLCQITFRKWYAATELSTLTHEDVRAFLWIDQHTRPDDVIMNNYSDAGIWIPAVAGRQITTYHTNPIDADLLDAPPESPAYAYIGERSTVENGTRAVESYIASHPDAYTLIYRDHHVRIYQRTPQ